MKKGKIFSTVLLAVILTMGIACFDSSGSSDSSTSSANNNEEATNSSEVTSSGAVTTQPAASATATDAAVKTILWQNDGSGFLQYSTNNVANCGKFSNYVIDIYTPMTTVEADVKKISGSTTNGYGIYFCAQDTNNFYRVLISTNGTYLVSKKQMGFFLYDNAGTWKTSIPSPWATSTSLKTGYNVVNNIKVIHNGTGSFDLYFNGVKDITFIDSSFKGGFYGLWAIVGSTTDEAFPNTPVDVRGKIIPSTDSLAVSTIDWVNDGLGFVQYYTNNSSNCNTEKIKLHSSVATPMTNLQVQVKKMYGFYGAGYGIVYCYQDTNNYYRVLVNTAGQYQISKKVSGTQSFYTAGAWTTTVPTTWPTGVNVKLGYNVVNIIKVVNNGSGNFDLFFNGVKEISFNDSAFTGGDSGYFAAVGSDSIEKFPNVPVDIRARKD